MTMRSFRMLSLQTGEGGSKGRARIGSLFCTNFRRCIVGVFELDVHSPTLTGVRIWGTPSRGARRMHMGFHVQV